MQWFILFLIFMIKNGVTRGFAPKEITYRLRRGRRGLVTGKVLSWNLNYLQFRLNREDMEGAKTTACNAIRECDIAALQEASGFYNSISCEDDSFHSERAGEFVVLASKTVYDNIEATFIDPKGKFLITLITPKELNDAPVIVINCHLSEGTSRAKKMERRQSLDLIRSMAMASVEGRTLVRDPIVLILGTFNAKLNDSIDLLNFKLSNDDKAFFSLQNFDGKDPFTTPSGEIYDGVLVKETSKLNEEGMQDEDNPFRNQDPLRYAKEADRRLYFLRLVNNWNLARYTAGKGTEADNLSQCIKSYIADRSKTTCPSSWVSSHEVSDHLPLRLKVTLPSSKTIQIGTWNINRVGLEERLSDISVLEKVNKVFGNFDILVMQEIPRSLHPTPNKATKFLVETFGVTGLLGYTVNFQHGLLLSSKVMLKRGTLPEMAILRMQPSFQTNAGFYKLLINDDGTNVVLCLISVHLSSKSTWTDVLLAVNSLASRKYDCNFVAAMGDFNSIKNGISDITKWTNHNKKVNFTVTPEACSHTNPQYKYTRLQSHHRHDYIFVFKMDSPISLEGCDILRTGDESTVSEVEDWCEVSDHYPVRVEI